MWWFWFVFALVLGAGVLALVLWLRSRDIKVTWYEWLIGIVGLLLLLIAVQHYVGSLAEMYPAAGWMGALIVGVPALVLLAVAWLLAWRRQRVGS